MRGHGPHGPRNMQMWLANNLNTTETLIGITADQQDAWRGYTNAVLAMFERPARPDVKPGDKADAAKVPFAREERLIRMATDRAAKAADLSKAIEALKAKLTPEQMQKLADKVINEDLSVRATEAAAKALPAAGAKKVKPQPGARRAYLDEVSGKLGDRLNTRVKITLGARKGQVAIEFASIQDLNRILSELGEEQYGS